MEKDEDKDDDDERLNGNLASKLIVSKAHQWCDEGFISSTTLITTLNWWWTLKIV